MLAQLRSIARSPIAVVVIIAPIILAFALFGISDIFTGGGNAVAVVGPERVTARELVTSFNQRLRVIQQENPGFTQEQADQAGLGDQVLRELIADAAIQAKADALGLAVADERLREELESIEAFQSPITGRFDATAYRAALANIGVNDPALFEADVRDDLRRGQYLTALFSGVAAPDTLARARAAYENQRRTVRALFIPPSAVAAPEPPTDETLAAFIEENAEAFTFPEQRAFTLVRISPDLLVRDVEVSEEDLRALYDSRLETGELGAPATRTFRLFPADDAETAEAAAERLRAGEDAAAVAAELGLGEAVDFDAVQNWEVPDAEVADAVFALDAGAVAAVEGRLGWRVVIVDEAVAAEAPPFETARADIQAELAVDEAERIMFDKLALFEEARSGGATLEEAAEAAGVPLERFGLVTADGISLDDGRLATLSGESDILSTVFELPVGFASDLGEFGEAGWFAARVERIEPSRVAALDEVRAEAEQFWRFRELDRRLREIADDALARAEAGEDLDALAGDIEGARVEQATLGRGETAGPFGAGLVRTAFGSGVDQPFLARGGDGRGYAVAVVTEAETPDAALDAEARQALDQALIQDLGVALEQALLTEYPARVDERLRDQALGRTDPAAAP